MLEWIHFYVLFHQFFVVAFTATTTSYTNSHSHTQTFPRLSFVPSCRCMVPETTCLCQTSLKLRERENFVCSVTRAQDTDATRFVLFCLFFLLFPCNVIYTVYRRLVLFLVQYVDATRFFCFVLLLLLLLLLLLFLCNVIDTVYRRLGLFFVMI